MSVKADLHFKVCASNAGKSHLSTFGDTSRAKWKCTTSKVRQHECALAFDGTRHASKRMTLQNIRNSSAVSTPLLCFPHVWYMTQVVEYLSSPSRILHRVRRLQGLYQGLLCCVVAGHRLSGAGGMGGSFGGLLSFWVCFCTILINLAACLPARFISQKQLFCCLCYLKINRLK